MKHKIKLLDFQSEQLVLMPEQGMGYQIVDIELNNGQRLEKLIVIDSTYLMVEEENKLIESKDILSIKLHQ